MRRVPFVRLGVLTASAAVGLAAPAAAQAQRDSVRVEVSGGLAAELERVARGLIEKRRAQIDLSRQLRALSLQLQRASSEDARSETEQSLKRIEIRLRSTAREGIELRRRLGEMCNEDQQADGWLGVVLESPVELRDSGGEIARRFIDYPTIVSVEPGSPAAKAGMEAGDRVLVFDGRDARTPNLDINTFLHAGARLPVKVRRGMQPRTLMVVVERKPEGFAPPCPWIDETVVNALREVPNEMVFVTGGPDRWFNVPIEAPPTAAPPAPRVAVPPPPGAPMAFSFSLFNGADIGAIAGAQITAMNQDLGAVFGVNRGLLVIKVLPGTPAEQAGLRGGDVIVSADGSRTTDAASLQRAMARSSDQRVRLSVVRKKKAVGVDLAW